ncbi:hypothetical protein [Shewanella baltica]|uniref:hypothetical protein n=1 Tax=Shewanella baltica TaxID=62322 RepID=UPI003D798BED
MSTPVLYLFVFCCCFFVISFIYEVGYRNVHPGDFFIAYKSFFYLIILAPFAGKHLFSIYQLRLLFRCLLFVFLIKYILWLFFADFNRPGVFAENNFELMFLLLLTIAVRIRTGKIENFELIILSLVMFMSGSQSGLLSFFFVLLVYSFQQIDFKFLLKIVGLSVILLGIVTIVLSRLGSGGIESVDRYVFLQGFILAISNWDVGNFLIGNYGLTPLPDYVCSRLSFYETLFSLSGDGTCYSVVLHSYLLRAFYDHGILGLLFLVVGLAILMFKSNMSFKHSVAIFGVLALNALSVSSFNSVYSAIGLVLLLASTEVNSGVCNEKQKNRS